MVKTILSIIGSMIFPPSVLPRVCVGPSIVPEHLGRVNISWDTLPCHLQNGADITGYIIQYTSLSTGVARRIPSSSQSVQCYQEFGDLHSCVAAFSIFPHNQAYGIQVAAQNNFGEGPFSDPINATVPISQGIVLRL